ncbi:hypothetical protein [Polyangium aurulentum]|uniref:hypothetical protein n=1 Tax=Polyangium aurulentum TaxID=2567896 RepID=UPI0010ADEBF7|nr:hypothetical protein [Polyangium aurulentum]UQA58446.1 hypothetical protein E8A73_045575 [Polyangium aurulentum]
MNRAQTTLLALALTLAAPHLGGCEDKPSPGAAPTSSALAPAKPKTEAARTFVVDAQGSRASFLMDAPIEKIHGDALDAITGEVFVDLEDLTKSTGLLKVDLDKLVLYQQKRENETAAFSERSKSDLQNEHARNWLEIGKDVSEETKKKNRFVELKITKVETAGPKNVLTMTGADRKVELTVTGDLRLHERTVPKTAKIEATFEYEGDKLVSLAVKTVEPIAVSLEEHDVRPRDTLGKILQKTQEELSTLGKKVSKDAMISVDFTAKAR